ncbi:metallophosphoesterase [Aquifex sp.]
MVHLISDTHFYHENIVNLNPKVRFVGFEVVILNNLYKTLKEGDILFHLGDFTWHFNDEQGYLKIWKGLPAKKILVMGNHDRNREKLSEYFDEIYELYTIIEYENVRILLSHYPALDPLTNRYPERQELIREVYFKEGCDLLIHGHVHWNERGIRCGCREVGVNCYNVNVEWNGYNAVSLSKILKEVKNE